MASEFLPIDMMKQNQLDELRNRKNKLVRALENNCSMKWCLTLWSRFIKARDGFQCVNCKSCAQIQAHHIFRKVTYPDGSLMTGNGITLCKDCHNKVHAEFNGRPIPSEPLNYRGGDDQDEIAYLYEALWDDAKERNLDPDEFYFISDQMLIFFVDVQGYEELYQAVQDGSLSRLRMAYKIWKVMPKVWYKNIAGKLAEEYLSLSLIH